MVVKLEPIIDSLEKDANILARIRGALAPRLSSALLHSEPPPLPSSMVSRIPFRSPVTPPPPIPSGHAQAVVDSTRDVLKGVPSWLLGGTLGGATGMFVDDDDRLRGAANGALIGGLGGYMWDRLPGTAPGHTVTASEKQSFISPSISSGGTLGLSYSPATERLPGTSVFTSRDVIERAGKAMDQGSNYEDIVAAGADSPKVRYLPMASAVLGGLVGRSLRNTPGGWLGGGMAGLGAGYLGRGRLQKSVDEESREATKGLLLERSRMGDPHARNLILQHESDLFPKTSPPTIG